MMNVEYYSAPQLLGFPYQHMMIDEDYKNVSAFVIESQSKDESTSDRSVLYAQIDVCSYVLYISCHFLTFIYTRMIVVPEYCNFSLLSL